MTSPKLTLLAITATTLLALSNSADGYPIPIPGPVPVSHAAAQPGFGSLFPGGGLSAFTRSYRTTNGKNADFSCTRNGKPCAEFAAAEPKRPVTDDGDESDEEEHDDDDDDNDDSSTTGSLSVNTYDDGAGTEGETVIIDVEKSTVTDEESIDFSSESNTDDQPTDIIDEDSQTSFSASCTMNGIPCGSFVPGQQREITIERTASCERNGLPCELFEKEDIDPDRIGEQVSVERKNKSFRTCTRNGVPCDQAQEDVALGGASANESGENENSRVVVVSGEVEHKLNVSNDMIEKEVPVC